MPPTSHVRAFVWVFSLLCLTALALVLLDEFSGYQWPGTVIAIGQKLGLLCFTAVTITFISIEGGSMLAAWLKKEDIKKAREEERRRMLEADRQRRPGETLEQALARLEAEQGNRR